MSTATISDLKSFVGYAELERLYGWKRRTLQDWVRKGKLRRGTPMPGGNVAWRVEDIQQFYSVQFGDLAASAVSDPSKLAPHQIEDAAFELAARHLSASVGEPVRPDAVFMGAVRPAAPAEHAARQREALDTFRVSPFKDLSEAQQVAVALHLCPALRPILGKASGNPGIASLDDDTALRIAVEALQ